MKWQMETNYDFLQANLPPMYGFSQTPDARLQAAATAAERTGTVGPLVREELKTRIQKRRLEEGLPEIELQPSPPRKYKMTPYEEEKRERRKAQNRKAAMKCRQKKKQQQDSVQTTHKKVTEKREQLKKEISVLQQYVSGLQKLLFTHMAVCSLRTPVSSCDQQHQQQQQQHHQQAPNYQQQDLHQHPHQEELQLAAATTTSDAPLTSDGFMCTSTDIAAMFPDLDSNNLILESVSAIEDLKDLKTTDLPNFTSQDQTPQVAGGPGQMWQAESQSSFIPVTTVTQANMATWQSAQQPTFAVTQHCTLTSTLTQHYTPTSASTATTSDVDHNDLPGYPFSHRRRHNTSQGYLQPATSSAAYVPIPTAPKSAPPVLPKSVSPNLQVPQSAQLTTAIVSLPFDFGNWRSHQSNCAGAAQSQVQTSATPPPPCNFLTAASPLAPASPLVPQQVVPGTADPTPSTSPAPFFDDQLRLRLDSCFGSTAIPERECLSTSMPELAFDDYFMSSQED